MDNENIILLYLELLAVQALEGLELIEVEHSILAKVHKGNHSRDQEELVAKAALELQKSFTRIVHSLEWTNIDGLLHFREKIYVPQTLDLCRKTIALYHNTKIAKHPR